MATCAQCGQPVSFWKRDLFTGTCPNCRAIGTHPATLGCGTLLLIGVVVLIFSRPGLGELESKMSNLQSTADELKKASDAQTREIQDLRRAVEELRKAGGK